MYAIRSYYGSKDKPGVTEVTIMTETGCNARKACERFLEEAFARLEVAQEMRQLLRAPRRETRFELPLVCDSGELKVFYGFRNNFV